MAIDEAQGSAAAERPLRGKVALVTGAGRGIGRAVSLSLAQAGAHVVLVARSVDQLEKVAAEITAAGGSASLQRTDVSLEDDVAALFAGVRARQGRLDVLVNNAGFLRDRMFVSTSEEEWDAVMRVHLKGHFAPARHAAAYWRDAAKRGETVDARIINTTSGAGLLGSVGQSSYSAAKAGIAALTLVQAAELGRYGVTANAVAPAARTRMTETAFAEMMKKPDAGFDAMDPDNIAPLVTWLASAEARPITGRVFEVSGGALSVATGWGQGPRVDKGSRWDPRELGAVVHDLVGSAPRPLPVYGA